MKPRPRCCPRSRKRWAPGSWPPPTNAFSFRHQLLGRAVGEVIPRPARKALHRQYGQILLGRGESAALAAGHLLQAAHPGDPASLADLDVAAAQTLRSAPQTAADLALRALELTPPADPGALSRAVAAAEALAAAGRLDQAARTAQHTLAKPLPPIVEARLRCALSSVLCARGQARDAAAEARMALAAAAATARPARPGDGRASAGLGRACTTSSPGRWPAPSSPTQASMTAMPSWRPWSPARSSAGTTGQVGDGLELLRDAARHGAGISPDARHVQPLLALAAALIDLRQLDEAEKILQAADSQTLHGIPAQAALSILRARIHLARGRPPRRRGGPGGPGHRRGLGRTATPPRRTPFSAVIALRRGDIAAAAQPHRLPARGRCRTSPACTRASRAPMAQAQIGEARDGPAAAIGHIRQVCADLPAPRDPARRTRLPRPGWCAPRWPRVTMSWPPWSPHGRRPRLGQSRMPGRHRRRGAQPRPRRPGPRPPGRGRRAAHRSVGPGFRGRRPRRPARPAGGSGPGDPPSHPGHRRIPADRRDRRHGPRPPPAPQARRAAPPLDTIGARPVSGWESLTGTERAASELVAQGLNNRQVANRMYISVHTVAFHMRQIFRKLKIGSRVELARIVVQQSQQGPRGPHRQTC